MKINLSKSLNNIFLLFFWYFDKYYLLHFPTVYTNQYPSTATQTIIVPRDFESFMKASSLTRFYETFPKTNEGESVDLDREVSYFIFILFMKPVKLVALGIKFSAIFYTLTCYLFSV